MNMQMLPVSMFHFTTCFKYEVSSFFSYTGVLNMISLLLIYDLQSKDWINTYYMLQGFLKAHMPPKVSDEMKCTNKKMIWNTQDTNLSWYLPNVNVDHIISDLMNSLTHFNPNLWQPGTLDCNSTLVNSSTYWNLTFVNVLIVTLPLRTCWGH